MPAATRSEAGGLQAGVTVQVEHLPGVGQALRSGHRCKEQQNRSCSFRFWAWLCLADLAQERCSGYGLLWKQNLPVVPRSSARCPLGVQEPCGCCCKVPGVGYCSDSHDNTDSGSPRLCGQTLVTPELMQVPVGVSSDGWKEAFLRESLCLDEASRAGLSHQKTSTITSGSVS